MRPKDEPIGEIAVSNPAAIAVFEKDGIDYCCRGDRLLRDVLRERGIPLESVAEELGAAETQGAPCAEIDWNSSSLADLIQYILTKHHVYLKNELPQLESMLAKVIDTHRARHGASLLPLRKLFQRFQEGVDQHVWKEEAILFPAIVALEEACVAGRLLPRPPFGAFSNPIRMMMLEHETAGWELEEMREITGNYTPPMDACETYRNLLRRLEALEADMHVHIHLENNILFPACSSPRAASRGFPLGHRN